MKKMTSKEFKEIVSKSLHYNCNINFETILLDLCVYCIDERNKMENSGHIKSAKHYENAKIILQEELIKRGIL